RRCCWAHLDGPTGRSFFFQAEDGIRDRNVTGVQTCALPITLAMVTLGGTFMADSVSAEKSLDDVKEERQAIESKLSKAESEIADILYEIKDLNSEVSKLEAVLKQNEGKLDGIEKKIKKYNKEIGKLEDRIEERNEVFKKRISAYQENGGNPTFVDVLLGSEDFSEIFSRSEAASTIAEA